MPNRFRPLSCLWLTVISVFFMAGCSGSGSGSGGSASPPPALATISPTSASAGASSLTITAAGSNFTSASQIEVGGTPVATTFVSSSQLTATIPSSQLANGGTIQVTVVTGGQTSSPLTFTVNNPAPAIVSVAPASVAAGSTAASITVTGTGFVSSTTASVNGSARPTALLGSTQLLVTLSATDLSTVGTIPIVLANPSPGGGTSAASNVTVDSSDANSPKLSSVSPTTIFVGNPDTTLSLIGTNFNSACSVQVNGHTVSSSYLAATTMNFTASASLFSSSGTLSVTASCLGITSNALSIAVVNPPAPTLASVLRAIPINTQTTVSASGTGFTGQTVLQLNGVSLSTTYKSSTNLTAVIPASAIPTFGSYSITAYTPAPGGGTSTALPITPYVGLPNNSMAYNPADGLFYLSVPSSAGAPYGNSVVSVDPVTGAIGTPIPVGSEPDRLAISSDGAILWVGLDGGASVRKVDLATKTASYSFTLGGNAGLNGGVAKALSLSPIPGAPDTVAVAAYTNSTNNSLAIFDFGVPRPNSYSTFITDYPTALQIDGVKGEIYAAAIESYYVYTYSSTGLAAKTTVSDEGFGSSTNDDLQYIAGRLYTDVGRIFDSESGSLLGTLYGSGTTIATGPTVADITLGKIFVFDRPVHTDQIQTFDINTLASINAVPVYGISASDAPHLTRWGSNGLAFRTNIGFFSLRSNLVNDLSSTNADLGVTVSAPSTAVTGSTVSYTVTASNAGPSPASSVSLSYAAPSNGVVTGATSSQGSCNTSGACDLGSLSSSGSATVNVSVQVLTSGTATLTANLIGSENDPTSTNNSALAAVAVTGATYNLAPSIASLSPSSIQIGLSTDSTITVNGANFTSTSTVALGASPLATTYVSATQLTAVVPQAASASLGWAAISVSTPAPGGGTSNMLPLSFFQVLTAGINHILYDPFSRKIMAAVGSGSSTLSGNSIVALTPETATFGTPVSLGGRPTNFALSSDGSLLYTVVPDSEIVARFNMLSQSLDFTFPVPAPQYASNPTLQNLAVEPGSPNTVVVDFGATNGMAVYDFNSSLKTATIRGQITGGFGSGIGLQFLDPTNLFDFTPDSSQSLNHFTLGASGFTYSSTPYDQSHLVNFSLFKIRDNLAFANQGGVADPSVTPAAQVGVYPPPIGDPNATRVVEPDTNLSRVFFVSAFPNSLTGNPDGITTYDEQTFLPIANTSLNMQAIDGGSGVFNGIDLIRWGQDGLAALTSGGHIYLLRGAAVVPAELTSNSAATLSALSTNSLTAGTGNTTITVTGSGFIRGAGVFWNGSYRTTTYTDSSHLTAAVPASDLAAAGTASITVNNPNATASNTLSITIQ